MVHLAENGRSTLPLNSQRRREQEVIDWRQKERGINHGDCTTVGWRQFEPVLFKLCIEPDRLPLHFEGWEAVLCQIIRQSLRGMFRCHRQRLQGSVVQGRTLHEKCFNCRLQGLVSRQALCLQEWEDILWQTSFEFQCRCTSTRVSRSTRNETILTNIFIDLATRNEKKAQKFLQTVK